jgi:hypothetical protein
MVSRTMWFSVILSLTSVAGARTSPTELHNDEGGTTLAAGESSLPGHVFQRNFVHGHAVLRYRERQYSPVRPKGYTIVSTSGESGGFRRL